mgnify:CR=1 FL=1
MRTLTETEFLKKLDAHQDYMDAGQDPHDILCVVECILPPDLKLKELSIIGVIFDDCVIQASFEDCEIIRSQFTRCTFTGDIIETPIQNSSFTDCDFTGCVISESSFDGLVFRRCNFQDTKFLLVGINDTNFQGSTLTNNLFHQITLVSCDLGETIVTENTLISSELTGGIYGNGWIKNFIHTNTTIDWSSRFLVSDILLRKAAGDIMALSFAGLIRVTNHDFGAYTEHPSFEWASGVLKEYTGCPMRPLNQGGQQTQVFLD